MPYALCSGFAALRKALCAMIGPGAPLDYFFAVGGNIPFSRR
jgi:hypothetical protein